MTRSKTIHTSTSNARRAPARSFSSESGSLIEIHDAAGAYVVVIFSPDGEGACQHAQARAEIRCDGGVWLHWSCDCCGEGLAHCHPVEVDA